MVWLRRAYSRAGKAAASGLLSAAFAAGSYYAYEVAEENSQVVSEFYERPDVDERGEPVTRFGYDVERVYNDQGYAALWMARLSGLAALTLVPVFGYNAGRSIGHYRRHRRALERGRSDGPAPKE